MPATRHGAIAADAAKPARYPQVAAQPTEVKVTTGEVELTMDVEFEGDCDSAGWIARITGANPSDVWAAGVAVVEIADRKDARFKHSATGHIKGFTITGDAPFHA